MAIYVLIHGATAGGWYLRNVADRLQVQGHQVYRPTLTGLGERAHLLSREVDLETHIQDIVGVLYYEDLTDVILVGKSYSGMVISGVAEKVPERIRHLVYLDAVVPQDGQSMADILPPEVAAGFETVAREHGEGWFFPANRSLEPRVTDHPFKTFTQPLVIVNPAALALPRTYIYCTKKPASFPLAAFLAQTAQRAKLEGWGYYELPTGHEPERDMPEELCEILLELG